MSSILINELSNNLNEYIIIVNGMLDLYTIIVAIFTALALLNLLVLKLSVKDNVIISKIRHKKKQS